MLLVKMIIVYFISLFPLIFGDVSVPDYEEYHADEFGAVQKLLRTPFNFYYHKNDKLNVSLILNNIKPNMTVGVYFSYRSSGGKQKERLINDKKYTFTDDMDVAVLPAIDLRLFKKSDVMLHLELCTRRRGCSRKIIAQGQLAAEDVQGSPICLNSNKCDISVDLADLATEMNAGNESHFKATVRATKPVTQTTAARQSNTDISNVVETATTVSTDIARDNAGDPARDHASDTARDQASDTATTQVIRVSHKRNNEEFRVSKDKPLKIILEDPTSVVLECNNFYWNIRNRAFTTRTEFNKTMNNFIEVKNVTDDMSTRWKCTILQEYNGAAEYMYNNKRYTVMELFFQIHVKCAKEIMLIANDAVLPTVTTNQTADYDAEAHYTYDDGEDIYFECKIKDYNMADLDKLRMEYYNAQGGLIFKTMASKTNSTEFHSALKLENNNYYVDCIRMTLRPNREYRYRVYFNLRKQHLDTNKYALTLYVNGERQLLCRKQRYPSYDDYRTYKYIEGEQFDVTCKKDRTLEGNLRFYFDTNTVASKEMVAIFISHSEIMIPFKALEHNINKSVVCVINNTDVKKQSARIGFKSVLALWGVRILGLPRKNIMYQYMNNSKWTTAYQFSVNETLNLTCVTKIRSEDIALHSNAYAFLWQFEEKTQTSWGDSMTSSSTVIESESTFVKVLDKRHNQTKIQCTYLGNYRTAEIVLHLKPELPSSDIAAANTNYITIITTGVLSAVALIVIIVIIAIIINKRRPPRTQESRPAARPDPFYLNMLFRKECDREIQELEEHKYEEIKEHLYDEVK